IEGFTAGIAVVIVLQQVPNALGVSAAEGLEQVWAIAADAVGRFAAAPDWTPLVMTFVVAAFIIAGARWKPAVPFSLIAVVAATGIAYLWLPDLATIGAIPAGLPLPSADFVDASRLAALLPSAFAVAALAALESLLCATVADSMSVNERHNPDRELFGQG